MMIAGFPSMDDENNVMMRRSRSRSPRSRRPVRRPRRRVARSRSRSR